MTRMPKSLRPSVIGMALCALSTPALLAAQPTMPNPPGPSREAPADTNPMRNPAATPTPATQPQARYARVRAQELIGMDVRDNAGQRIGDIEDLMIDTRTGEVRFAVLAFGGFMGMGEQLRAYPTSAFDANLHSGSLTLKLPQQRLKQAQGFERERWPSDVTFWQRIEEQFGGGQRGQQAGAAALARATQLLGMDVADRRGQDVGEVHDLIVHLGQRRVQSVVLEFDRAWNPDDKLIALPMSAFQPLAQGQDALAVKQDREQLRDMPSFNRSEWPTLTQAGLRERYEGYWNNAPTPVPEHSTAFRAIDRNGDGVLTADEYDASFTRMDADRDGRLSQQEMQTPTPDRASARTQ